MRITNFEQYKAVESQIDSKRSYLEKNGQRINDSEIMFFSNEMVNDLKNENPNWNFDWFIGDNLYHNEECIFANNGVYHGYLLAPEPPVPPRTKRN